jgi:hypothetical protein
VFWIDGICINQADLKERALQVLLMASIYKNASRVVIDLGESSLDSNLAISSIKAIYQLTSPGSVTITSGVPASKSDIDAIYNLINRPWFSRVWVLSEVFMAKDDLPMICGKDSMMLSTLHFTLWWLKNRNSKLRQELITLKMYTGFEQSLHSGHSKFFKMLQEAQLCQSSDPRDKVFALLPMFSEIPHPDLRPDYEISVRDLYIRLARYLLETTGLSLLGCIQGPSSIDNLPSWVPDWSHLSVNNSFSFHIRYHSTPAGAYTLRTTEEGQCALGLQGFRIGRICHLSYIIDVPTYGFNTIQNLFSRVYHHVESDVRMPTCQEGETNQDMLFQTFVPPDVVAYGQEEITVEFEKIGHGPDLIYGQDGSFARLLEDVIPGKHDKRGKRRRRIIKHMENRRFCAVNTMFPAIVPRETDYKDELCVIDHCTVPLVLRRDESNWRLIGPAFVAGLMDVQGRPKLQVMDRIRNMRAAESPAVPDREQFWIV